MNNINEFLEFINDSPTCFHACQNVVDMMRQFGYTELKETEKFVVNKGGKYFVVRNNSSIIAFNIGKRLKNYSFNITASHTDSPTFKIKPKYELENGPFMSLNTEKYGSSILSTWFDKPLSIAGRVIIKNENAYETRLISIDEDLLVIPNLAIHMNRTVNDGYKYNEQADTIPLMSLEKGRSLGKIIASELGVLEETIIGSDLYLYNRFRGCLLGANKEMILAPQLDDLQCVFGTLKGFLNQFHQDSINVFAVFDNEEVGSSTKQGAGSNFLIQTLKRINEKLGFDEEDLAIALSSSFVISADNAHAVHPNKKQISDPTNAVLMNEGIVIKYNADQNYTTDSLSAALFMEFCKKANVKYQAYTNRSDVRGGKTLGSILINNVSVTSVDIGFAQLAMHSSCETAGAKDLEDFIKVIELFYNNHIIRINDNIVIVEV